METRHVIHVINQETLLSFSFKLVNSYIHPNPSILLQTYELTERNYNQQIHNSVINHLREKVEELLKNNLNLKLSDIFFSSIDSPSLSSSSFCFFKPDLNKNSETTLSRNNRIGQFPSTVEQRQWNNFKKGILDSLDSYYNELIEQANSLDKKKLLEDAESDKINFNNKLNIHMHVLKGNINDFVFTTFTHGNHNGMNFKFCNFDLKGKYRTQYFSNDIIRVIFGNQRQCQIRKIDGFNYYTFKMPYSHHPGSWIFQQCNLNQKTNVTVDMLTDAFAFLVLDLYQKQHGLNIINNTFERAYKLPTSEDNSLVSTIMDITKED